MNSQNLLLFFARDTFISQKYGFWSRASIHPDTREKLKRVP